VRAGWFITPTGTTWYVIYIVTPPPVGEQSVVVSTFVCLFVCLSAQISLEPHVQTSANFLCMLSTTMALPFGGFVIKHCYVLLVLWMTSCFLIMGPVVM